jgi:hypothetical protein
MGDKMVYSVRSQMYNYMLKEKNLGQVLWLLPVIPATQEVEIGRMFLVPGQPG